MTPHDAGGAQSAHASTELDERVDARREAATRRMFDEVIAGLSASPRSLPSKYFYDEAGSRLFDEITRLDEYYLTRAETRIMEAHAGDMARAIGPGALLVEFGSGSSVKTQVLLDCLDGPAGYMPIDISGDYLEAVAGRLRKRHPGVPILPVVADFTEPLSLPRPPTKPVRRIVYFPGSTIGNFPVLAAVRLLGRMRGLAGRGGAVLIGFDLLKSRARLHAAYNDEAGVTARFNLNLLEHVNREIGADFDLDGWEHRAPFNEEASRIEMHLVSRRGQTVHVGDRAFEFAAGEVIVTEFSHKYTREAFAELAGTAGLRSVSEWADPEGLFCVQLLVSTQG